jgi:hypothetical protein
MRALYFAAVVNLATSQIVSGSEEMQKLIDTLSGRWSITQENSDGSTAHGEEAWYAAPGGTPLVEEYRVKDSHGRDIADYATVWWDAASKHYSGVWCAEFTDEGCTPFTVEWHGVTIEMRGAYSVHGKHFRWRELFEITSHDLFTQTLHIGPDGEDLRLRGTVHGTRLATSPLSSATPK